MADPLRPVELFGGAAEIAIPERLQDVSAFRPVPNNQEVYTDADRDQSLIIEIVEQVSVQDSESAQHCFTDLANVSGALVQRVQSESVLGPQHMPGVPAEAYKALIMGEQMVSKGRQRAEAANKVQVILAIIRLKDHSSEVLVTMNTPVFISEQSAAAGNVGAGHKGDHLAAPDLFIKILSTFTIKDYGLFG